MNLALIACSAGTVMADELPVIREVVVTSSGKGARVEIRSDKPIKFTSYFMPELAKWVVDMPNSVPALAEESKRVATFPLERVTVREKEINGVPFSRIGLDVSGEVAFSAGTDSLDKGLLTIYLTPSPKGSAQMKSYGVTEVEPPNAVRSLNVDGAKHSADPRNRWLPAKNVTAININYDSIKLEADGSLAGYRSFTLKQPARLVFDFDHTECAIKKVNVTENRFGIVRGRVGKSEGKLRIVFETGSDRFPEFAVKEHAQGVEILPAPQ